MTCSQDSAAMPDALPVAIAETGRWEVPAIGPSLVAAHALLGDYPSIGLADAMNAVLAREYRTDVIATLDRRHFRMIRPLTRHAAFRLLPDDVPTAALPLAGSVWLDRGATVRSG
jgi:predicted nucleic acid-binding protein